MVLKRPTKEDEDLYMAAACTRDWLEGVIEEGAWLLNSVQMARTMTSPETDRVAARRHFSRVTRYEHYFVVALNNSLRWASRLVKLDGSMQAAVQAHRDANPHAKDVRNMREHADEYFDGEGNAQKRFLAGDGARYVSDATSTVIIDGRYLLGGRLDVRAAMDAANALLTELGDRPFG